MKAFAYLRVSGKGQLDGDGFTRQGVAIAAYAQANGLEIVQTFEERGITGGAVAEDRPAWTGMIAQRKLLGVSSIVIEKRDPLARDLMVQERLLPDSQKAGPSVISSCEPDLGVTDPTRVAIR